MLTKELLAKFLHYDPKTGVFTRTMNTRSARAGDVAGGRMVHPNGKTYLRISVCGKDYYSHRLAWLYMTGRFPSAEVDHEDGDGTNNKWPNINRSVDHRTNSRNRSLSIRNKSGCMGVSWDSLRGRWKASIRVNGKTIELGRFVDKDAADKAARAARAEHGFHANHGQPRRY